MSKKTACPIPLPLTNSERLLLHEEVLIGMLNTVEEFRPYHMATVLKVLLAPDKIRLEMGVLRDTCPTITSSPQRNPNEKS